VIPTLEKNRKRAYFRLFGADAALREMIRPGIRVLDVGCSDGRGSEVLGDVGAYGVDVYRPALFTARQSGRRVLPAQADARRLPYRSGSFDVVVALDVIEHFDKPDALSMIGEMERVSRNIVVLLTPNGFVPQPGTDDEPWQEHRCGFTAYELSHRGYDVRGVGGPARLRGEYGRFAAGGFGKVAAAATAPLVRRYPEAAFHLLAVRKTLG
jgi:SAM-dependent methyltransferase